MEETFESKLCIEGYIRHVIPLPAATTPSLITSSSSSSSYSSVPSLAFVIDNHLPSSKPSVPAIGPAAAIGRSSLVLVLEGGDWSKSCAFVAVGDEAILNGFTVFPVKGRAVIQQVNQWIKSQPAVTPSPSGTGGSSAAPRPYDNVLSDLCMVASPNAFTELTVVRKKRVVINFSNVGNLRMMDLTDRERRGAEWTHQQRTAVVGGGGGGGIAPPPHQQMSPTPQLYPNHSTIVAFPARSQPPQALALLNEDSNSHKHAAASTALQVISRVHSDHVSPNEHIGNSFHGLDRYFDVLFGASAVVHEQITFLVALIGSQTKVLEVGARSGLYSFTLRAMGVSPIACLESSTTMIKILNEKNAFFRDVESSRSSGERRSTPLVTVHPGSVTSFVLARLNLLKGGEEGVEEFDTVLCLHNTIALLPSLDAVKQAFHCLSLHTALGGKLVITVPNTEVVVQRGNLQSTYHAEMKQGALAAGATNAMLPGTVDLIQRVTIAVPALATVGAYRIPNERGAVSADRATMHPTNRSAVVQDGIARRTTQYLGSAHHPDASTDEGIFVELQDSTVELLLRPSVLEDIAASNGLKVKAVYGSLRGDPFQPGVSDTRVYVFVRTEM